MASHDIRHGPCLLLFSPDMFRPLKRSPLVAFVLDCCVRSRLSRSFLFVKHRIVAYDVKLVAHHVKLVDYHIKLVFYQHKLVANHINHLVLWNFWITLLGSFLQMTIISFLSPNSLYLF